MLFNGRQIQLYRLLFTKPIRNQLIVDLDLGDISQMRKASEQLLPLTKHAVERGELEDYWRRVDALTPTSLLKTIYTEDVIRAIRLKVKKQSGISFSQEEILEAVHQLILVGCMEAIKPKHLK